MKLVTQEHPFGCGVACVASLCGIGYNSALKLFGKPSYARTRGYYCSEVCSALVKKGRYCVFQKYSIRSSALLSQAGTIVFVSRSEEYPYGHYLLKTLSGWMNPWINHPCIKPARAGFQRKLPGKPQWIISEGRKSRRAGAMMDIS